MQHHIQKRKKMLEKRERIINELGRMSMEKLKKDIKAKRNYPHNISDEEAEKIRAKEISMLRKAQLIDKNHHKKCLDYTKEVVKITHTAIREDEKEPSGMYYNIIKNEVNVSSNYLASRSCYYSVLAHEATHSLNSIGRQAKLILLSKRVRPYQLVFDRRVQIRGQQTGLVLPVKDQRIIKAIQGISYAKSEFQNLEIIKYNVLARVLQKQAVEPINVWRAAFILENTPGYDKSVDWVKNRLNNIPTQQELQQQVAGRISNLNKLEKGLGRVEMMKHTNILAYNSYDNF